MHFNIDLKPSWCKGGRTRSIDVKTQEQRQLLDKIKSVVGKQNQSLEFRIYDP
jgi:hypothetical protein